MAVQVPARYGVEGYGFGVVNFYLASHPARCLWPSTASASDAFSAYAIEEPNRWLFFTVQVPAGCHPFPVQRNMILSSTIVHVTP